VPGDATNQKLIESAVESSTGIFMVLSVFLLAPFVEEMLFRKFLYGIFEDKLRLRPLFAILISAILFAAMHAVDIFFFRYLPLALVLCIAYSLSKNNIFVPMGIHFLNNSTIIIFFIKTVLK
jgi:membrane protease YdiL (CAAX protease family)